MDPIVPDNPKRQSGSRRSIWLLGFIAVIIVLPVIFTLSLGNTGIFIPFATTTPTPTVTASPTATLVSDLINIETDPQVQIPTIESDDGVILFASNRRDRWELYMMGASGEPVEEIAGVELSAIVHPAWSADGLQIALLESLRHLNIIGPNGLTTYTYRDAYGTENFFHVAWSPDGNQVVHASTKDSAQFDLYLFTLGTGEQQRLTFHEANDVHPSWSPNGRTIAFTSLRDENHEIYLLDADGENLRRLTENKVIDELPVWSPDGTQIAFSSHRGEAGSIDLWVMNADGTDQRPLLEDGHENLMNDWSPDERSIVFSSTRDGNWELYVLTLETGAIRRLTNNDAVDNWASWRER